MRSISIASTALSLATLVVPGHAFWRMSCPGRLMDARMDPIVSPGGIAGHLHTISGGSAFNFDMTYADTQKSACSSCQIKQDLSNYWTPTLFYQTQDGKFQPVPQVGDGVGSYGGMTVYYLQRGGPNNDKLQAYPEGFRMLAGNPFKREYTNDFAGQAVSFVCLDYNGKSGYYNKLPDRPCPDGIRAQIFFPSCWDGKNLDSPNHMSHMAYPTKYSYDNGPCPATHPVHMVSVFFEVIWDAASFPWWVPDGGWQPFVFSMGDPTGYGYHGDFLNGWDVKTLQNATDTCTNLSGKVEDCPVFEFFDSATMKGCINPSPVVGEKISGTLDQMPGCNPVTYSNAAPVSGCQTTAKIGDPPKVYTEVDGWDYVGCGPDNGGDRTLSGAQWWDDSVTIEGCMDFCGAKGFKYAGLEYANQCFCGNSIAPERMPKPGVTGNCFMPCKGNSSEFCGNGGQLSLYKLKGDYTPITIDGPAKYACPYGNGKQYVSANGTFQIDCGTDWSGGDLKNGVKYVSQAGNITQCIEFCAATDKCTYVSLGGTACYMKTGNLVSKASSGVQGAHVVAFGNGMPAVPPPSPPTDTTTTTTKASTTTSKTTTTTTPIVAGATYTSAPTCPLYDGAYYQANANSLFLIECYVDHAGGDMGSATVSSFKDCVDLCANTPGCLTVATSGSACYLKNKVGSANSNSQVRGARLVLTSTTTTTTSSSTTTTTSTPMQNKNPVTTTSRQPASTVPLTGPTPTVTSLSAVCPGSNDTIYYDPATNYKFQIECGIDHSGGDMGMVSAKNLTMCIGSCASTKGCVDVSLSGTACYMKSKLGKAVANSGVRGAKLVAFERDDAAVDDSQRLQQKQQGQATTSSTTMTTTTLPFGKRTTVGPPMTAG